jgi:hypothetical protein
MCHRSDHFATRFVEANVDGDVEKIERMGSRAGERDVEHRLRTEQKREKDEGGDEDQPREGLWSTDHI